MVAAAIVGGAAISAGSSYMAGNAQADGARDAAGLQAQAQMQATAESRRQYDTLRTDLAPYRETGANALQQYGALYGIGQDGPLSADDMQAARDMFQTTPGYEFALEEGQRALDRSASARGTLLGGGYGRELVRYGQGMANQEFNNYADRLAGLATMGQNSSAQTGTAGMQSAGQVGNALMTGANMQGTSLQNAATARASAYAGVGQAAGNAANNYAFYQAMQG